MGNWEIIDGFEGQYMVSDRGQVFSFKSNRLLTPHPDKDGYMIVKVGGRNLKVHRLVATAFIPLVIDKNEVNHRDECKSNNAVENLEWVNRSENARYGHGKDRQRFPVIQLDTAGNIIKEYASLCAASEATGIRDECISRSARGRYHTAGGYRWEFKNGNK